MNVQEIYELKVRKIIIFTDGDELARQVIERVAQEIGGRCISRSAGNPTPLTGEQIVQQILLAKREPVLVMFDDNGDKGYGRGERALEYVATHPQIYVLGAIAVASKTQYVEGAKIDLALDNDGNMIYSSVNKDGEEEFSEELKIYGDTVDILNRLSIPVIIGLGDIGKMKGKDQLSYGAPITKKAVQIILKKSSFYESV